ncbi:uncharacterized protein SAMN02745181_2683 [Rubritalea squalenifaciens DSM 18772]|uniref:DUF177 domain-containing protein n=2 Tax=Rubritalea TaxID=361050 RepID=A0A1M6MC35_9BACT|nr:hypothetical protein [Rubritalea squalenifaciens]SHJ81004.1 uncharacterized protein SAMN02745181_2683 [Rubritalea squalenifaciens DSM 18772]
MRKTLIIDLATLPEEGKEFSGELDPTVFDLPKGDAQPQGPLEYDLYVQRFEDELLFRGSISAAFQFECVRDNQLFTQTISIEECAIAIEIESSTVDATEALREEVLINFPAYPRCDEADEPHECNIDERYLAVDKPTDDGVDEAPPSEGDDPWSALDSFKHLSD